MTTLFNAFQDSFDNNAPGTSKEWAQGNLSWDDTGTANFVDPLGNKTSFTKDTPLASVYNSNPFIAQAWDDRYGTDVTGGLKPQSNFEIPMNLFPSTVSNSSSNSINNSSSGINWNADVAKAMLPNLISSGQGALDSANNLSAVLREQYANTMRQAMQPENFQGVLNQLSNQGMVDSTTGANAMATAGRGVARDIGNQAIDAEVAGLNAKMQVPGILSNIVALANESKSSGKSSSSSSSKTENPLAPYELMASKFM